MFSPSRAFLRSLGLILLSAGLAQPGRLVADGPGCGCPPPCAPTCCAQVPCPPPDVCTCTTYKPVCDTCYHQQPLVTYRDVCKTCYRKEPYCVTVPVTKVDCVTVDEGCYKMVWCPRPVTKQIPRVEYHQQVCCRTVPYTVSQRVPQVTTQIVPEYRVRYCPETHTFIKPPCRPCPCCPPVAPGCGVPNPYLSQATPPGFMPQQAMASIPAQQLQQQQQPTLAADSPQLMPVPQAAPQGASNNNANNDSFTRALGPRPTSGKRIEIWPPSNSPVKTSKASEGQSLVL